MRIFINGFGRIGRTILRQVLTGASTDVEIVGINDIAPLETCAYLLKFDSVFGPFPQSVKAGEIEITIGHTRIPFTTVDDISSLDLSEVDLVFECTGHANTKEVAMRGLEAGAKYVLISGPSSAADVTVVLGVNEDQLGNAQIVSNASCTTNAIAPLLRVLDAEWGLAHAHITTIHCYTGSQPTVDTPASSFMRSRAAAVSMVPTSTSAAQQIKVVLPELTDRLSVAAVRVPVISVSAIDVVLQLVEPLNQPVLQALEQTFVGSNVVGLTHDACVSIDMRGRAESLVLAMPETQLTGDQQVRLFGWYDNEWGFSARMLDMAKQIIARG
ncbi:MAG: glyceraldehyde 3-phosphate dehydrogenase NAD-binding domain-containing protein [Amylibacter sp.]|nr:glyceraldehyde 3-phosphate dehydrogenase NAD-binding domain-containing protein [Amylibacter sp.]MDG1999961.1 glyceraldehyde 3-phosphate dehydrogenase NAD-binding domain-containing protein [Amylibacter sp.]